jgi:hypothetical protein
MNVITATAVFITDCSVISHYIFCVTVCEIKSKLNKMKTKLQANAEMIQRHYFM